MVSKTLPRLARTECVIGESGKLYLAAILDLCSRFVVGGAVSAVNDRHLTIKALEMGLKRRCPDVGLLHHSDQGSPYASEDDHTLLGAHGMTCSMSRRGNCYDNAVMEAFFSSVKSELADRFDSCGEAKMELFDYVEVFYNQRRRHSTLGQISPAAYERQAMSRQRLVRSPREVMSPKPGYGSRTGDSTAWPAGRSSLLEPSVRSRMLRSGSEG